MSEAARSAHADLLSDRAEIERVLLSQEEILGRVSELGAEISQYYGDRVPLLVGVLNGAVVFMADLVRKLDLTVNFEFMAVSSYGDSTESSGVVRIAKDLDSSISGREVLIVEDIVDSGLTLKYLVELLRGRSPADIKIVALFRKDRDDARDVDVDWIGFDIPDVFVVGYGLDFAGKYRNLPYLGELKT